MTSIATITTASDKISRGIIELQKPQPFFAHLIMHLYPKLMPKDYPMQTAGVDAKGNLYYAEDFVMKLPRAEVTGLLCHEVLHVAFLHCIRTGTRNKEVANIAQDVVVNMMVTKAGMKLPETTIEIKGQKLKVSGIPYNSYDDTSEFTLNGVRICIRQVSTKLWEQVYDEIEQSFHKQGKELPNPQGVRSIGFDSHQKGDSGEGEALSPQEQQELAERWSGNLVEAAQFAKQQGKLPDGMNRYVDDLLKPKVRWKSLLMKYLKQSTNPVDWTYQRLHRKSQILEMPLPNTIKENCEVEVLVDTSGSIGNTEMKEFLTEIVAIAKSMNHVKMWVSSIDADVHTRYEVANGDIPKILSMEFKGGGGTDMEFGLDYIKEHNRQIPVAVVLTDGYTSFNKRRIDYPFDVIWVITKKGTSDKIPYGAVVRMD